MPKKRQFRFEKSRDSPVHSERNDNCKSNVHSLASYGIDTSASAQSVNARLARLRRAEATSSGDLQQSSGTAPARHLPLVNTVVPHQPGLTLDTRRTGEGAGNQRAVGTRLGPSNQSSNESGHERRFGYRGLAGPLPPRSWIVNENMQNAEDRGDEPHAGNTNYAAPTIREARICPLPGLELPRPRSLVGYVLRAMARHWPEHVHFDGQYLADLSIWHKECLLHYIGISCADGIGKEGFRYLLAPGLHHTPEQGVGRLDLNFALGPNLNLRDLLSWAKSHRNKNQVSVEGENDEKSVGADTEADWDSILSHPTHDGLMSLRTPSLHSITHLSVAFPDSRLNPTRLWKDLTQLAKFLPNLTHLSMIGWPSPAARLERMIEEYESPDAGLEAMSMSEQFEAGIIARLARETPLLSWFEISPWSYACGLRSELISWWQPEHPMQTVRFTPANLSKASDHQRGKAKVFIHYLSKHLEAAYPDSTTCWPKTAELHSRAPHAIIVRRKTSAPASTSTSTDDSETTYTQKVLRFELGS